LNTREKGSIFGCYPDTETQPSLEDNNELDLMISNVGIISLETELKMLFDDLEALEVHTALAEKSETPFYEEAEVIIQAQIKRLQEK